MRVLHGVEHPLARLQDWYGSPLGQAVARIECATVQRLLCNTFGYHLVQIGATDVFGDALAASRVRHRVTMSCGRPATLQGGELLGCETQFPLASDSIDAVFLPHSLDFTQDPFAVLREVERVLIPEGRVLIVGFNPLSAWGLRRLLWSSRDQLPWCGRFRTPLQVEDWLRALGFAIEIREYDMFCLPMRGALEAHCNPIDRLGRRFWPPLGGIYSIRAVKRVAPLTLTRNFRLRRRAPLVGGAVEPTTRGTSHA